MTMHWYEYVSGTTHWFIKAKDKIAADALMIAGQPGEPGESYSPEKTYRCYVDNRYEDVKTLLLKQYNLIPEDFSKQTFVYANGRSFYVNERMRLKPKRPRKPPEKLKRCCYTYRYNHEVYFIIAKDGVAANDIARELYGVSPRSFLFINSTTQLALLRYYLTVTDFGNGFVTANNTGRNSDIVTFYISENVSNGVPCIEKPKTKSKTIKSKTPKTKIDKKWYTYQLDSFVYFVVSKDLPSADKIAARLYGLSSSSFIFADLTEELCLQRFKLTRADFGTAFYVKNNTVNFTHIKYFYISEKSKESPKLKPKSKPAAGYCATYRSNNNGSKNDNVYFIIANDLSAANTVATQLYGLDPIETYRNSHPNKTEALQRYNLNVSDFGQGFVFLNGSGGRINSFYINENISGTMAIKESLLPIHKKRCGVCRAN